MAAKRISDIAKELGIKSQSIIDKCLAEGIPSDKVKGHMSTVSAGLEASIREWFATSGGGTAVETAEHPDVEQIRAAPKRPSRSKKAGEHASDGEDASAGSGGSSTSTTMQPPLPPRKRPPGRGDGSDPANDGPHDQQLGLVHQVHGPTVRGPATIGTATGTGSTSAPSAQQQSNAPHTAQPSTPASIQGTATGTPTVKPSPQSPAARAPQDRQAPGMEIDLDAPTRAATRIVEPRHATPGPSGPAGQANRGQSDRASGGQRPTSGSGQQGQAQQGQAPQGQTPHGQAPHGQAPQGQSQQGQSQQGQSQHGPVGQSQTGPGHGPGQGHHGSGHAPHQPMRGPVRPILPNVPTRPSVVTPAGPQLGERTAVKLTGPKVVRIEAPDVMDRPRPRRDGPGGDQGQGGARPGGGNRPGGAPRVGDREDDRGGARRGGGAGAGAGAGAGSTARRKDTDRGAVPARRRGFSDTPETMATGLWREQDLAEREARLSRSSGYLKQRRQQLKRAGGLAGERAHSAAETGGKVVIIAPFTIKDLSATTGVKAADIIKKLFLQGIMATVNSGIDPQRAQEVMIDFDIELDVQAEKTAEEVVSEQFVDRDAVDVRSRGPIVTILGHVDHGKTSLLDKIRNANVAAGEAGGITQATSAFRVPVQVGGETKQILFLDTPGHEAFTSMRARGAQITDIVVLVVSAPEGVMPQTVESINHAKAAGVPIVVALNKIDRPDATDAKINQTLGELAKNGLNPVEWGGDVEIVRTSATKGTGIDKLLEILDLQGQLLDLKADYGGAARGSVVEARLQEGRGAVANIIVQDGELAVGDFIVVGRAFGRVRDIVDDRNQRHKTVGPASVVQISGFDALPDAGDKFYIVESLRQAQEAAEQRRERDRETDLSKPKVTLDSLLSQMKEADTKEILVVFKADVQGTIDVVTNEIEKIKTSEVRVRVLHAAVGGIQESDVLLADASRAIIIGFNVIPSNKARSLAEAKGVEIRTYQVIYDITDDLRKAAEGLLEPERKTQILGHADVRAVFRISKVGTVAGCFVTDGVVERDALIRVTRNGIVIENDRKLEQLKRVKDDAKEVRAGLECGMKIVGYDDIKEGDVLECYKNIEVKRTLS